MEYTVELAEKIAARLRALPKVENKKRRINKQEMVERFAAEIADAQTRGYSLEEIIDFLKGDGFDIGLPTLKTYLQRTQKRRSKKKVPTVRRQTSENSSTPSPDKTATPLATQSKTAPKTEPVRPASHDRTATAAKFEAAEKKKGDNPEFQSEDTFK